MAPKYVPPSVEPILEASEDDESRDGHRDAGSEHTQSARSARRRTSSQPHTDMTHRSRRKIHKGPSSVTSSKHGKSRAKVDSRRTKIRGDSSSISSSGRRRHRRTISRSASPSSSSSSSSDEEERVEDHQVALTAARNKLTSPSALSTLTTLTTATNTSSGSSGSNSTITQASMSKSSSKQPNASSKSSVPPEAPNVFAYMEQEQDEPPPEAMPFLNPNRPSYPAIPGSFSSSMTTLFNFSNSSSEPTNDQGTDRSSSPDQESVTNWEQSPPSASTKLDRQLRAAQDHQGSSSSAKTFAQPAPISTAQATFIPPPDDGLPAPTREPPFSGYDLLATQLSDASISPIYRRFSKLNHRVLLHLQDEITELQDRLQYLDDVDTHYRTIIDASLQPHIQPSGRRSGSALEWNRSDILNRLGYKLPQYNKALASFSKVSSASMPPCDRDIEAYNALLEREKPLVAPEATFLSDKDDLVLLRTGSKVKREFSVPSSHTILQGKSLRAHIAIVVAMSLHLLAWGCFTSTFSRLLIGASMVTGLYISLSKRFWPWQA